MESKLNFQRPSQDRRNSIFGQMSNEQLVGIGSGNKGTKFANQSTLINSDSFQIDYEEIKRCDSNGESLAGAKLQVLGTKKIKPIIDESQLQVPLTISPLAPLMADVPPVDFKMISEIDIGVQNYTLKSINGNLKNCFRYLPLNQTGLVIGMGKSAEKIQNDNRKYWNFEESNFQEEHCYILYRPEFMVFIIKDLSYKEVKQPIIPSILPMTEKKQSQAGTWLSIPNLIASHDWFNLHSSSNYKREFKIVVNNQELPFKFTDQEGDVISSLHQWCSHRQALDQFPIFQKLGFNTINDFRSTNVPIQFKKMVQQGNYSNEIQRVEAFNKIYRKWMDSQKLSENNGKNPSVLCLHIKLSHKSDKETQYRLDGQRVLIVSADNQKASQANLILDYPWLRDFEMVIDYNDKIFDANAPVSGLVLQTFQSYHREFPLATVFYKMKRQENTVLQPGTIVSLVNCQFLVERFNTGVVAVIGNRSNMEDAYFISHDLALDSILKVSYFCVIDGHGGDVCALFLRREMIPTLTQFLRETNIQDLEKVAFGTKLEQIINQTYQTLDYNYSVCHPEISKNAGAVVVSCLIIGNQLYCINLGDSRAIICRNGFATELSQDHKATLPSEINRVKLKGGIIMGGRLGGRLAITRAFGDHELKLQVGEFGEVHNQEYLTVIPEIRQYEIDPCQDDFLILGSDGLFDKLSSQECCDFVLKEIQAQPYGENNLQAISEKLANVAIFRERVKDNVTVMIVGFNRGLKSKF